MKTITRSIALVLLLAAVTLAQRPFGDMTGSAPDPTTMIQRHIQRLTNLLSLTPAQVTQATTIFTSSMNAVTPLQSTLNTDRQSLQTAVKGNATATIDQLAAAMGTLSGQIIAIQNKADAAFYAILTPDQQTKLNTTGGMGGGMGPGGGRGMMGGGRMGGGGR